MEEQMDVGQEHSMDTNTDMLNGVTEAPQEEAVAEDVNGHGAVDAEMAGTT